MNKKGVYKKCGLMTSAAGSMTLCHRKKVLKRNNNKNNKKYSRHRGVQEN